MSVGVYRRCHLTKFPGYTTLNKNQAQFIQQMLATADGEEELKLFHEQTGNEPSKKRNPLPMTPEVRTPEWIVASWH